MDRTKLTTKDRIELMKHLKYLLRDIERDEGENFSFNTMNRIKTKITDRFNIMLEDTFK